MKMSLSLEKMRRSLSLGVVVMMMVMVLLALFAGMGQAQPFRGVEVVLANAIPNLPWDGDVDFYIGGELVASNVSIGESTGQLMVNPGQHTVLATLGNSNYAIAELSVDFVKGTGYILPAVGLYHLQTGTGCSFIEVPLNLTNPPGYDAWVGFANLAPSSVPLDFSAKGHALAKNLAYPSITSQFTPILGGDTVFTYSPSKDLDDNDKLKNATFNQQLFVPANTFSIVSAIGTGQAEDLDLYVISIPADVN